MQLRAAGQVLEDPEVDEYVDSLGHRLSAHAQDGDQSFEFFIVNDPGINAFALPGGFIGVNSGLILTTQRESELAGVLAHEIAHVTQKHIARRAAATGKSSMLAGAAVLAAILMGIAGQADTDMVQATAMSAQALAIQQSINYTRVNEYEADRVGLSILVDSGF
ncbi:MAG: M48 family metalloprotease, partial [Gammaproteobacteria bacterium]